MHNNFLVIMAGGVGSRFWPFSRTKTPKQFLDVLGTGKTMIQQTAERFEGLIPKENIYIVTNTSYIDHVKEQLPYLKDSQILAEPVGRNTAPCIAYAVSKISMQNPDANVVVCPSDHIILKEDAFRSKISEGIDYVNANDALLTLGIKPSRPDTGYGYIQFIENATSVKMVKTFTEKPDYELALTFIDSGDFLWNAGIFVWNVKSIEKAMEAFLPEVYDLFEEGKKHYFSESENAYIQKAYSLCRSISIDYGVMEKAKNVHVLPGEFGWSDLGTWKSLFEVKDKNEDQNVVEGKALLYNTKNCIVKGEKDNLIVVEGLEDYIVVQHDNVVMICRKEEEQQVKNFVTDVKQRKDLQKFI